jgi:DNA (cytosine-5)-methyltransferase 1
MKYFLDLFSGIGGFALGAYRAGLRFNGHYFSEIDDYAVKVYQKRFPGAIPLGDIRNVKCGELPNGEWIIAGGFPCQDISIAGKGAGLEGSRSGLWYEYARLISGIRPKFAIVENVGAWGLDRVLGSLSQIGYNAVWQDLRASDLGAPHKRERIWIIAYPQSERWGVVQKSKNSSYKESCGKKRQDWANVQFAVTGAYSVELREGDESHVCGMDDGLPYWMDRLRCTGNAVIPQIPELIFGSCFFDEWRTGTVSS